MKKLSKNTISMIVFCSIIAFLCLFFCSKNSPLYPFNNWVDENAFYTVGRAWRHGILPYRDLFEQKGPLLYLIFSLSSWITPNNFFCIFIIELISYTIFLYYSGKIIHLFLEQKYSYYILPIYASLITSSIFFSQGGSAEELCLPLLTITLYQFLKYFHLEKDPNFFVIGFFAGCMAMIKFTFLGFPFAFMMCIALSLWKKHQYQKALKSSLIFLGGMSLPILAFSLYFLANHGFQDFIDTYLLFNIFHYTKKISFLSRVQGIFISFYGKLSHNVIVFNLIEVGCIYFLCTNFLKKKEAKISFLTFFVVGALGIYWGMKDFFYYFLMIMPFTLFGFISLMKFVENKQIKKTILQESLMKISIPILFCFLILTSPNLEYAQNKKEDLVQYRFAEIIKNSGGKTLLNYQFLDGGFYLASNILPNTKYFEKQNAKVPNMDHELNQMISLKQFDFIVLRRTKTSPPINERIIKNYLLVATQKEKSGRKEYLYQLYKKIDRKEEITDEKERL